VVPIFYNVIISSLSFPELIGGLNAVSALFDAWLERVCVYVLARQNENE